MSAQSLTFDVVSIKRNAASQAGRFENPTRIDRPDGGFMYTSIPVMTLIARAYAIDAPGDIVGLPDWARREYYNVSATSTTRPRQTTASRCCVRCLPIASSSSSTSRSASSPSTNCFSREATADWDRACSHRTWIAPRSSKRNAWRSRPRRRRARLLLGQRLQISRHHPRRVRCGRSRPSSAIAATAKGGFDLLEGETTIANLAQGLRMTMRRLVVDKTGLTGTYRMKMNVDQRAAIETPVANPDPDAPPSIFTAMREQLGLKLEASKIDSDTLIVDRLERPMEN